MKIDRKPNNYYPELSSYSFSENGTMLCIYLSEDKSLNFTITNLDLMAACEELNEFIITKENIEVYEIFNSLLDDFEKLSPLVDLSNKLLSQFDDEKNNGPYRHVDKLYNKNLFFKPYEEPDVYKDGCITWQSDSSYYCTINTLRIRKVDRGIRLSIKTSAKTDIYLGRNVKIDNIYSKQSPYSFLFMKFYYHLQKVDPEYHQMSLFEL